MPKKAAKPSGKHGLSDDEVADLQEAFNMFDIDGDGERETYPDLLFAVTNVFCPIRGSS
jgi:hypothetical protein